MTLSIQHFFDPFTYTLTYCVFDPQSKDAVVIDPVLDYEPNSSSIDDHSIQKLLQFVTTQKLNVLGLLETHAHADHISGSKILKQKYFPQAQTAIGKKISLVQETFKHVYNFKDLVTDGSQFDILFEDNQTINFGTIAVKAMETPGHTPACLSYLVEDNLFTGDALFIEDYGTGRCDFPKGDAKELYHSIQNKIYQLAETTKIYPGHDYLPNNRELIFQSTVKKQKEANIHLKVQTSESEFIKMRQARDKTLEAPRLLLPSIQMNINAGSLPQPEDNDKRYLKIPLNLKVEY